MLGISVSNFHELVPVVENKDPHTLHARLEQTPSESHLQISTKHTILLWARTDVFNDDFGRLMGSNHSFEASELAVINTFFITCDNSPDKSNIHDITNKLTTYSHSTLSLLRCQFMRYRSTASVWFSKCLNLAMYITFRCTKFFWQPTSTFFLRIFFQNSAYFLNIP